MSKLSYEDKINIYNNKKEGMSIKTLSKKYDLRDNKRIYAKDRSQKIDGAGILS